MQWNPCNTVLIYNLPRLSLQPAVENILKQRGIQCIAVRCAWDIFTMPAFLCIIDPGFFQAGGPERVDRDELSYCFKNSRSLTHLAGCYFFTRTLSIDIPPGIKKRIFPLPLQITEGFLARLVDYSSAACRRGPNNGIQT